MSRVSLLPEQQLTDLLLLVGRGIREMKSGQAVPAEALVFYEVGNTGQWDFDGMVTVGGGNQQAAFVAFTVTATAKRHDTVLLADLIVDRLIVAGEEIQRVDILPVRTAEQYRRKWNILVYPSARGRVNAKLKCFVASNNSVSIQAMEGRS